MVEWKPPLTGANSDGRLLQVSFREEGEVPAYLASLIRVQDETPAAEIALEAIS